MRKRRRRDERPARRPARPVNPRAGRRRTRGSSKPAAVEPAVDAASLAILRERAQRLARRPTEKVTRGTEVLVCRLAGERYAVALHALRAIQPSAGLTPIPCTPSYVAGGLNVRGEVVTVVDLGIALGLTTSRSPGHQVLLVELGTIRVGLLVDEVLAIEHLVPEELARAVSTREFSHGVAGGNTTYLSLESLLTEARFTVQDEVN